MIKPIVNETQKSNLISYGKVWVRHNIEDATRFGKVVWSIVEPVLSEAHTKLQEEAKNMKAENNSCHCGDDCECKKDKQTIHVEQVNESEEN